MRFERLGPVRRRSAEFCPGFSINHGGGRFSGRRRLNENMPPTTTEPTVVSAATPTTSVLPPTTPAPTTTTSAIVLPDGDLCSRFEAMANPDDNAELADLLDGVGPPAELWGEADGSFEISVPAGHVCVYRDGNLSAGSVSEHGELTADTDPPDGYAEVMYFPAQARLDCTHFDLTGD
jgi:hypothetical protein